MAVYCKRHERHHVTDTGATEIKVKKRQQFSAIHLKEFTQVNHLHLQSIFFTLVVSSESGLKVGKSS